MVADLYEDLVTGQPTTTRAGVSDDDDFERRLARARGKARAEGFADGAASAEATFDREMQVRVDAVKEALTQFAADRHAADKIAIETIRQILANALAAFTAPVADAALPALVADIVAQALTAELAGVVVVEITAERLSDVQTTLDGRDKRLTFKEDPHLAPGTARVIWRGGFDHIDANAAITAGAALLDERLRVNAPFRRAAETAQGRSPGFTSHLDSDGIPIIDATNSQKEEKS